MRARKLKPPVVTREALAAAIESAIDTLNALDGDTDLEPDDDCCTAGEDDFRRFSASDTCCGAMEDDEPDTEEPSLGSLDGMHNQERWAEGGRRDLEGDEHDGREPDVDDEYSLGWPEFPRSEVPQYAMSGDAVDKED